MDIINIVKKEMSSKKNAIEEKARLDTNSQGCSHDPLNAENVFEENGVEEDSEFKHTNYQERILDEMEKKLQDDEKMLFFIHSASSAVK